MNKILRSKIILVTVAALATVIGLILTIFSMVLTSTHSDVNMAVHNNLSVIETSSDRQLVGNRQGELFCYDLSGGLIWKTQALTQDPISDIDISGDEVLFTINKKVYSAQLSDGTILANTDVDYPAANIVANDEFAIVYGKGASSAKYRLYAYNRVGGITDFSKIVARFSTEIEIKSIEYSADGVLCLGADSEVYTWNPSTEEYNSLFALESHKLAYITRTKDEFVGISDKSVFLRLDKSGTIEKQIEAKQLLKTSAASQGYVVATTYKNNLILFNGDKTFQVGISPGVERIMMDGQSVFMLDRDDRISPYDFKYIQRNHIWKVMLILAAVLLGVATVLLVISFLLLAPRVGDAVAGKIKSFGSAVKRHYKTYLFLLIPFGLLGIFSYFPMIWGFLLSFTSYLPGRSMEFVGLGNFIAVFNRAEFWGSMKNMVLFLCTDIVKALIPCLILAEVMFLMRAKRMSYVMRLLTVLPSILPGVAMLYIWTSGIYGENGLVNMFLQKLGLSQFNFNWLAREKTALGSLMVYGLPYLGSYIMLFGALHSVPASLIEAAKLDGCTVLRRIFTIDIPLLTPQFKYIFVTTFIGSVQDFGRSYMTTGGDYGTMIPSLEVYLQIQVYSNYGMAAAMSLVLFVLIFAVSMVNMKIKTESIY